MNNFPENENNNIEEEQSTVFSAPKVHKQVSVKSGNKKRLKIVIASLCVVALLVSGIFAAVKLIPEKDDDTSTPTLEEIEVLKTDSKDYKTVTVKNENGSFKLYSVVTKAENEDSEDVVNWYIDGYDKALVNSSSISSVVSELSQISALREITEKSLADCGLENPKIKADMVTNDGAQFSILVGGKSPDNAGLYLKLSTKDTIYLIDSSIDETLTFAPLDFANSDAISGLSLGSDYSDYTQDGKLTSFDSITLTSKNFSKDLVMKPNKDEATLSFVPYLVTSPEDRTAENVDKVLALFADGVSATGAYSFDASAQSLSKFGLNNPDFTATVKLKNYSYTYKFKLQSDGNYAVVTNDSVMIKKISADAVEFLDYKATDFYANWVFIESIDNISNLTVKIGDKSYSMDVKANPDTEDDDNKYIVTYNGKNLKSDEFQTFYRFCISLSCSDYNTESLNTAEEASLTYTYNDNKIQPVTVGFKKATATKYQYSLNGKDMGKINASEFKKIDKYLQQLINGEKVTYN